jgi:hypothetical protein
LGVLHALLVASVSLGQVPDGALHFDETTDNIQVAGHTVLATAATFEARLFFPSGSGGAGMVFNEWTFGAEDKQLQAGPDRLRGYTFNTAPVLQHLTTLTADVWHHVAFVYDGGLGEQRLYLDGAKVAAQVTSGDIGNSDGNGPFVGSIFRDGLVVSSFRGYLDTLRISDVARYSGDSFTAPSGDLGDDADTVILYNFDESDFAFAGGQATVADLSGNGHTGTLGVGFDGATVPILPDTLDIDGNGAVTALTDGLLVLRDAFGLTGATLTNGVVGAGCSRCDAAAIEPYLAALGRTLDIDDNDAVAALTDGLLVVRSLFGLTDLALTNGVVGAGCMRCDAAAIVPYLQTVN